MRLRRRKGPAPTPVVVVPLEPLERLLEGRLGDLGTKLDDAVAGIGDVAARFREMAEQMTRQAGEQSDEYAP